MWLCGVLQVRLSAQRVNYGRNVYLFVNSPPSQFSYDSNLHTRICYFSEGGIYAPECGLTVRYVGLKRPIPEPPAQFPPEVCNATETDKSEWKPSPFMSIPSSFWFVLVTSTSVGYGDMFPTYATGLFASTFIMMLGTLVSFYFSKLHLVSISVFLQIFCLRQQLFVPFALRSSSLSYRLNYFDLRCACV